MTALPKTPEEVQQLRAKLSDRLYRKQFIKPGMPKVVAKGDSWFDYLPGLDVIRLLELDYGYGIENLSHAGDTAANMAWGTDIHWNFSPVLPPQIEETVAIVKRKKPRFVLISAGGNDIAGNNQFLAYLNHRDTNLAPLRVDYATYAQQIVEKSYRYILQRLFAAHPSVHVILHGYGYGQPDGRGVINAPFGFHWIGPWFRPALSRNRIEWSTDGRSVIRDLIDLHNDMLDRLSKDSAFNSRVHYIDLRKDIKETDWVNELHLYDHGFRKVARRFHDLMSGLQ
jgi:hypothetical protein